MAFGRNLEESVDNSETFRNFGVDARDPKNVADVKTDRHKTSTEQKKYRDEPYELNFSIIGGGIEAWSLFLRWWRPKLDQRTGRKSF